MILPDANLLIYAYDQLSPHHAKARAWWLSVLRGSDWIGIPNVVLLAFTRLMTHPHICTCPLSVEQVRSITDQWWSYPHVRLIQPSASGVSVFFDLLEAAGQGGNLTSDAWIAVCARECSATIYSNDNDFDRFPGIKRINPLKVP